MLRRYMQRHQFDLTKQRKLIVFLCVLCIISLSVCLSINSSMSRSINKQPSNESRPPCRLPNADEIAPRYGLLLNPSEIPFKCPESLYMRSFVTDEGILKFKIKSSHQLSTYYRTINHQRNSDDSVTFSNFHELHSDLNLVHRRIQFLEVVAIDSNEVIVYRKSHFYPSFDFNQIKPSHPKNNRKKYNVFILVIESLSRISFNRYLSKVDNVLRSKSGNASQLFDLKGLVKVVDDSYPNMIAALAGLNAFSDEINGTIHRDIDFVWKHFKSEGYATALVEDSPEFTLFNYLPDGFRKQPTHWYPRPYWLYVHSERKLDGKCYQDERLFSDLILGQADLFYKNGIRYDKPTFSFVFKSNITHDDLNAAKMIDTDLANFIDMFEHINDTIFILMGNHGIRYGEIPLTDAGWIEGRMPYFSMLLPQHLLKNYPHLTDNLKANEKRLTTWFDFHEMLMDIAIGNYSDIAESEVKLNRGLNPMRQVIPLTRDCKSADIPNTCCVCERRTELKVSWLKIWDQRIGTRRRLRELGLIVVEKMNIGLVNFTRICAKLELDKLVSAYAITPWSELSPEYNYNQVEVTISVKPSEGLFTTRLSKNNEASEWTVRDEITRVNKNGNESVCLDNKKLKPFCHCK